MLYGDKMPLRIHAPNVTLPYLQFVKLRISYALVPCQHRVKHTGRVLFVL